MIWYIIEKENKTNYLTSRITGDVLIERGWGNGYVALPPTHPLHLGNLDNITNSDIIFKKITLVQNLNVHGGATYSNLGDGVKAPKDWWVIGFDTAHYGDTIENWPKEAVEAETKKLFCQLFDIDLGGL